MKVKGRPGKQNYINYANLNLLGLAYAQLIKFGLICVTYKPDLYSLYSLSAMFDPGQYVLEALS